MTGAPWQRRPSRREGRPGRYTACRPSSAPCNTSLGALSSLLLWDTRSEGNEQGHLCLSLGGYAEGTFHREAGSFHPVWVYGPHPPSASAHGVQVQLTLARQKLGAHAGSGPRLLLTHRHCVVRAQDECECGGCWLEFPSGLSRRGLAHCTDCGRSPLLALRTPTSPGPHLLQKPGMVISWQCLSLMTIWPFQSIRVPPSPSPLSTSHS